jgi:hypothetical protein
MSSSSSSSTKQLVEVPNLGSVKYVENYKPIKPSLISRSILNGKVQESKEVDEENERMMKVYNEQFSKYLEAEKLNKMKKEIMEMISIKPKREEGKEEKIEG